MSGSTPRPNSLQEFLQLFSSSNDETRQRLLTEVFQSGRTPQTRNDELSAQVDRVQQQGQDQLATQQRESNAALTELRRELTRREGVVAGLNQRLAVSEFRLLQLQESQPLPIRRTPRPPSQNPNPTDSIKNLTELMASVTPPPDAIVQSQIALIYQNLGPEPQGYLDQYLQEDGFFDLPSIQAMWNVLDVSYRNQNEEEEARQAMNLLRQKSRSFGSFLAEFQRLRILAKIEDDKTLITALRAGVSDEMRRSDLAATGCPKIIHIRRIRRSLQGMPDTAGPGQTSAYPCLPPISPSGQSAKPSIRQPIRSPPDPSA
ncbi:hypothetical protein K3495_g8205 [Podosphaera aphanis]|nr:hypothetical protein K3495_g8205 [Podosphaera aphanis]